MHQSVFRFNESMRECIHYPIDYSSRAHMDQHTTTHSICTSKGMTAGSLQVGLYDIESHGNNYNFMHLRLSNKMALLVLDA